MLVYEITDVFSKKKIPFAIVGGLALAFHGIVRSTVDVDLVINLSGLHLEKAEQALKEIGLQSRIPVRAKDIAAFREEYIRDRNLIAWSFVDFKNPLRQVDILINLSLENLPHQTFKVGGVRIPVATLQALAEMKKTAGRPQDLVDLEKIYEKIKSTK